MHWSGYSVIQMAGKVLTDNKAGTRDRTVQFGPGHNATLDTSERFTTEQCGE